MIKKRLFDILVSLLALILFSPMFFVCAIAIKATSRGPIFYRGKRVGKGGDIFLMHKFRSMVINADKLGTDLAPRGDPRVTKFGRFLRRTKIDELPQFIDVLIGKMSIVGPRPESPMYAKYYNDRQKKVLDVKPGIVGLTQIKFRNEELILKDKPNPDEYYIKVLMPEKLEMDLNYIKNQSFFGDIWIVLKTFFVILR